MRSSVWSLVVLAVTAVASADDGTSIRVRRLGETQPEPWLHLDATTLDRIDGAGGISDGRAVLLDLGPRARVAVEGTWWQTGLAPSMFAEDLEFNGWRASGELSYDLGPFGIGINASMSRERDHNGDSTHRTVGLFAYRTFRLSRWMHAWVVFGVAFEQRTGDSGGRPQQGVNVGLTLGTTFR